MAFVDEGGARGHGLRFGWPPEDRPGQWPFSDHAGHKKGRSLGFAWPAFVGLLRTIWCLRMDLMRGQSLLNVR